MKKNGKICIIMTMIILVGVFIFFKNDAQIEDNIQVISKSENENIHTANDENKEYKEEENKKTENKNIESLKKSITIFISGQVNEPGVVTIESDKRLADAVDLLGGFTDEADLNKINLAMKIEDEKHYIIPKLGEDLDESNGGESLTTNDTSLQTENNKVNINTATLNELDILPGVGEATATKIINYRDENGKFNAIEEIKNVNGIGDKKYENIKDMISIN
ncbi:MAG: helix-hairpin-helix domain-containing protein [Romboutsia sp.]|uniref:helix-hairpin-helix domain-containing protein n=1 Tax=Romboutsia sp. TaxID=1965302 RepID=UPI003F2C4C32